MLLWDVVFGARERCGWEGKGAAAGGAGGCSGALQSVPPSACRGDIPAELLLLPRLWSRMALAEMPGFPGWVRLFRVVVFKRAFSGVPYSWWVFRS